VPQRHHRERHEGPRDACRAATPGPEAEKRYSAMDSWESEPCDTLTTILRPLPKDELKSVLRELAMDVQCGTGNDETPS
jgi:hypothetical protein